MNNRTPAAVFSQSLFILFLAMSVNPSASAAQVTIDFTGLVKAINGDMYGYFSLDEIAPTSQFSYSTDETQASLTNTAGSTAPGNSYDSLYHFSGVPNGITLTYPMILGPGPGPGPVTGSGTGADYAYDSGGNVEVRITNNRVIDQATSAAFTGLVTPGIYDWLDIRWTDSGLALGTGIDLQTWQLSVTSDASWFTDGTLIPDALPATFALLMYGSHDDSFGNHIGHMLAIPSSYSVGAPVSAVPVPPAAWLLASGLAGLGVTARRKQIA